MIDIKKILVLTVISVLFLQSCTSDDDGNANSSTAGDTTGDGISLAEANQIVTDADDINLDQVFSVRVVDGGGALEGATVTISLIPEYFYKGEWVGGTGSFVLTNFQRCTEVTGNENGNDIFDPAGQADIAPAPNDLVPTVSSSGTTKTLITNDKGEGYFSLRYARRAAGWVAFTINASTSLDGQTLTTSIVDFEPLQLAEVFADDTVAFAGQQSPFGAAGTCADFN